MALIVCTWWWGAKYGAAHLARLHNGVRRHLAQRARFVVFQPEADDEALKPGCLCRLKMFSPAWQERRNIGKGDRLVCLDLDSIVTGPLDPLFDRQEDFVILHGANAANPCPFNGSVMMLRAGAHPEVWDSFTLDAARAAPYYEFPDDQAWLWHKLPTAAGWQCGVATGIYAFKKPGWPQHSDDLPNDARLVVFPGKRDPSQFAHLPWVREHWR